MASVKDGMNIGCGFMIAILIFIFFGIPALLFILAGLIESLLRM